MTDDPFFNTRPPTFDATGDPPRRPVRRGKNPMRAIAWAALLIALIGGAVWGGFYLMYLRDLPPIPGEAELYSVNAAPGMTFLDQQGNRLAVRGPRHGRRARLKNLPAYVPRAFLAAEDRRFYDHGAVDWIGVARAARANFNAGGIVQGGSTLTQQLARTLFLNSNRTFRRKIQEAVLAYRLEEAMTKDQILELYLHRVFFGANAYGIDGAAQTYFGKTAAELTLSEAALLAALPKAPSRLSPARDMPAAIERSHLVLRRMQGEGWITEAQMRAAIAAPPALVPETPEDSDFGWLLDMAQAQAQRLADGRAPDLIVRLTVDSRLQPLAMQAVRGGVAGQGRRAGVRQAALVALSPDGGIRALAGGVDHRFSPFNRAAQAIRQPGSAFKPFVYAAALETGVSPTDLRSDSPLRLGRWAPGNYAGGYSGNVTVEDALARSINTVAVRLAREAGTERVASLAHRFGMKTIPDEPGLSVALGAYEVTLLDLVSAYQVFQHDGTRVEPYLIEDITTSGGQLIYHRPYGAPTRVYDPARGGDMVRMMKAVIKRGTGKRAAIGRPAAGKTGTSQSHRDAWFVGFTPDWVCGVWVGNDDNTPMNRVAGGDLPAQIWRRFMLTAHKGMPVREFEFLGGEPRDPDMPLPDDPDFASMADRAAREGFYRTLASEFARAATEASLDADGATQGAAP